MKLSIIAAQSKNGVIGRNGDLPWHLPADLRRFKRLTVGHVVIVGRKTHDSIVARLGGSLPERETIVVTSQLKRDYPGCSFVHSTIMAQKVADELTLSHDEEVFVIGGGEIYRQFLSQCERVYLTVIDAAFDGDSHFPPLADSEWSIASTESFASDESNPYPHTFTVYERVRR